VRPDCFGIIAGLGRGMPGRAGAAPGAPVAPGVPSRAAGGRCWRCMPCVEENGLLPGRAPLGGRGPGRGPPGRGPADGSVDGGLGPGVGAGPGRGTSLAGAGTSRSAAAGVGVGAAGLGAAGAGAAAARVGATGVGAAGAGAAGAAGASAAGAAGALGFGAALDGPGLAADFLDVPRSRSLSPNSSLRRRTTGASMVDDADFTYSPMSFNVDRMTLDSTPNSRASSWTLTATLLLQGVRPWRRLGPLVDVQAHWKELIECS